MEELAKNKKIVIGALHFMPLIGYDGFSSYDSILEKAKEDLRALEEGGVDAIILENNYNLPHRIKETEEAINMMKDLAADISGITPLPLGISLLWNDFSGALKIAKACNAKFIRVPVFVDDVETDFGKISAESSSVLKERKILDAENVLIFADIHVKHAKMLDPNKTIAESAKQAIASGADGIIITGKWTGDAPLIQDIKEAREAAGESFPVIVGSGADKCNIAELFKFADMAIVSTSLKEGQAENQEKERNLKPYSAFINLHKVKEFVNICRNELKSFKNNELLDLNMAKKEGFTVTPYEVKGDIDYDKLIKDFGISPLKELPEIFNENVLFRRKTIFAHRDIQRILEAIKNKKKFVMMTGLMPTGKMHIGHMILAQQMIFYQKLGAKIYIAVADIEAYNARGQSLEESRKIALEDYVLNYIALGLKPSNCEIYFQSERSNDAKKSNAYYRLQNLLSRYATFNEFKAVYGEITPGKMLASLLQASDMLHAQLPEFEGTCPVIVPVGVDQDPHIRLARDISQSIKEFKFTQLSSSYHLFIPGLGGGKMSSSDPTSFIALTDSPEEVKKKINKYAFSGGQATIEEHRKLGGNPDVDVSFQYLKMFFEEDDKKLAKIEADYRSGKLLTGELKAILIEKINAFLKEHQAKREQAKKQLDKFLFK